jgi:DNA gyrase inhibitor GyrI
MSTTHHRELIVKVWNEYITEISKHSDMRDALQFIHYVNETYGVQYNVHNVHYQITNEDKYMLFLLKFG